MKVLPTLVTNMKVFPTPGHYHEPIAPASHIKEIVIQQSIHLFDESSN